MKHFRWLTTRSLLTLCLLWQCTSAVANAAWYQVEVLLFERGSDLEVRQERLALEKPRQYPNRMLALVLDDAALLRQLGMTPDDLIAMRRDWFTDEPWPTFQSPSPAAAVDVNTEAELVDAFRAPPAVVEYELRLGRDDLTQVGSAEPNAETAAVEQQAAEHAEAQTALLRERSLRLLEPDQLRLQAQANRLRGSADLHVIWHGAWIQPVPDMDNPQPMLLQAGERQGDRWQYEGTLTVTLGRFLHFHALLWRDPTFADFSQPLRPYQLLDESRRMRSAELHYLDHPRFGLLVRIDPVDVTR